jgi:hypothetical protein
MENQAELKMKKGSQKSRARTPAWAIRLPVQHPPAGHFDIHALTWKLMEDNGIYHQVAAIPESRLPDFLVGEETRGHTSLLRKASCSKVNLLLDDKYVCKYGKQHHRRLQEGMNNQQHWDSAVSVGKMDSFSLGLTRKLDCTYHFRVNVFECLPEAVYIKFPMGKEVPTGVEQSPLHHLAADGVQAHATLQDMNIT